MSTDPTTATSPDPQPQPPEPQETVFILAFQGGGARGIYEAGAYAALHDHGIEPIAVSALSSGALNASVIVGNTPDRRVTRLNELWSILTAPGGWAPPGSWMNEMNRMMAMASLGVAKPGFYVPHVVPWWLAVPGTPAACSYYTNAPLGVTMSRVVDMAQLNHADSPVLGLGVTDAEKGELEFFCNRAQTIEVPHILATAALPVGAAAMRVGERYYWDGGVSGNSPLDWLGEAGTRAEVASLFLAGKRVVIVAIDLFSRSGPVPRTLIEAASRKQDIAYASSLQRSIDALRRVLRLHNHDAHIVRLCERWTSEPALLDPMDFSRHTLQKHRDNGYRDMELLLRLRPWEHDQCVGKPGVLHDVGGGILETSL